jgi:hypothetical protein
MISCIRTPNDSTGDVWIMHRSFHQACSIGNFQTRRSNCVYEFLHQVSSMSSWKTSFPILTIICGKLYIISGNVRLLTVPSVWVLFSVEFRVVTAICLYFSELISGCFRTTHLCILTGRLFRNLLHMLSFVKTKFFPIMCVVITASVGPNSRSFIDRFVSFVTPAAAHLLQFLIAVQSPDVHTRPSAAHPCYVANVPSV